MYTKRRATELDKLRAVINRVGGLAEYSVIYFIAFMSLILAPFELGSR